MPPPEALKETLLPPVTVKPKPSAPHHAKPRPPTPAQPPKPPLEGPKSLRDALAEITMTKKSAPPAPPQTSSLKETLHMVAPKKEEVSQETIRQMLDIDEPKDSR